MMVETCQNISHLQKNPPVAVNLHCAAQFSEQAAFEFLFFEREICWLTGPTA